MFKSHHSAWESGNFFASTRCYFTFRVGSRFAINFRIRVSFWAHFPRLTSGADSLAANRKAARFTDFVFGSVFGGTFVTLGQTKTTKYLYFENRPCLERPFGTLGQTKRTSVALKRFL